MVVRARFFLGFFFFLLVLYPLACCEQKKIFLLTVAYNHFVLKPTRREIFYRIKIEPDFKLRVFKFVKVSPIHIGRSIARIAVHLLAIHSTLTPSTYTAKDSSIAYAIGKRRGRTLSRHLNKLKSVSIRDPLLQSNRRVLPVRGIPSLYIPWEKTPMVEVTIVLRRALCLSQTV